MKGKGRKLIRAVLLVGMAVCLIQIGQACLLSVQHRAQQKEIKEIVKTEVDYPSQDTQSPKESVVTVSEIDYRKDGGVEINLESRPESEPESEPESVAEPAGKPEGGAEPVGKPDPVSKHVILSKYEDLYAENNELAGWLAIEGMKIDYPVMQCEDDEYYLHHDFYGKDSKYGCLYVKNQADLDAGTNFIIYGHNMKDGSMFGDLDLYLKESFFKEHPVISFDTLYEERTYEILAVFRSQVYNVDEDVFKYYQFYQADTREEFEDFYKNIKELSLYDTGVEAQFGDTFLTLSTCAYHVKDGRLVVVAKRTG